MNHPPLKQQHLSSNQIHFIWVSGCDGRRGSVHRQFDSSHILRTAVPSRPSKVDISSKIIQLLVQLKVSLFSQTQPIPGTLKLQWASQQRRVGTGPLGTSPGVPSSPLAAQNMRSGTGKLSETVLGDNQRQRRTET